VQWWTIHDGEDENWNEGFEADIEHVSTPQPLIVLRFSASNQSEIDQNDCKQYCRNFQWPSHLS